MNAGQELLVEKEKGRGKELFNTMATEVQALRKAVEQISREREIAIQQHADLLDYHNTCRTVLVAAGITANPLLHVMVREAAERLKEKEK